MITGEQGRRWLQSLTSSAAGAFCILFAAMLLLHLPLLALPAFWDEGYFVTVARDLYLGYGVIPQTVPSNGHPPLVFAWLALAWKWLGYDFVVTRVAMLAIASFGLAQVFAIARHVAGANVAWAAAICVSLYPVYFAQASLAHLDVAAAALTLAGVRSYLLGSRWTGLVFSLAVLAKATAVLMPSALFAWQVLASAANRETGVAPAAGMADATRRWAHLLLPSLTLSGWFAYHWHATGYVFGNPEFFHENLVLPANLFWFVITFPRRLWQVSGYMNLFVLIAAVLLGWRRTAVRPLPPDRQEAWRQFVAASTVGVLVYVTALSVVGRAVLARYMLPVVPLVIVLAVVLLWQRVRPWKTVVAAVCLSFVAGWFWEPPYASPPEDSLAYTRVVRLHKRAGEYLKSRYGGARILATWPLADQLRRPWLGYATVGSRVLDLGDLGEEEIRAWAARRDEFDVVVLIDHQARAYAIDRLPGVAWVKQRLGRRPRLSPRRAAERLGGQVVYEDAAGRTELLIVEIGRGGGGAR